MGTLAQNGVMLLAFGQFFVFPLLKKEQNCKVSTVFRYLGIYCNPHLFHYFVIITIIIMIRNVISVFLLDSPRNTTPKLAEFARCDFV